jgi:hypothetical protein
LRAVPVIAIAAAQVFIKTVLHLSLKLFSVILSIATQVIKTFFTIIPEIVAIACFP